MNSFQLEILSPERVFYRGECVSLILPISDGMLGIMANCEPLTAALNIGEAYYTKPDGEKILFSVSGGMVDVQGLKVTVLCDCALLPDEIDEEKQRQDAEKARSELAKSQSKTDYLLSQRLLMDAVNNLKIKQKKSIN